MRDGLRAQGGFALIVVLWAGLLLALMAAGFTSAVRARLRTTAGKAEIAQAESLAGAALNIAILEIVNARGAAPARFPLNGTPVACRIGEAAIIVEVEDDEGKVDLNAAPDALLTALFEGAGAEPGDAKLYAARIADYRDPDDETRDGGAERKEYVKASSVSSPSNADFVSVAELDQVLQLPADIVARVKPFVTTAAGHAGVDPAVASKQLRRLLARGASSFVREVTAEGQDSVFADSGLPPGFEWQSSRQAFTVRVQSLLPGGARYVAEAGFSIRNGTTPLMRYWRRSDGLVHTASPPIEGGPC